FALQVRTFHDLEAAGALARQLREAGYPAYVVTTHLPDGGESHRVRVGDYPDRREAEAAARAIAEATGLSPFVTLTLR
ncbi:MAG: SPOR domain-containing protein, partial [Nitrospirae bacterium]